MSLAVNAVFIAGNLTRDPELRYLQSGKACCKFGLAISNKRKDATGKLVDAPCFVNCTAWDKTAELVAQFLAKGRAALVEGRLDYHAWTTDAGDKRSALEVVANRVHFLGSAPGKDANADTASTANAPDPSLLPDDELTF